MKPPVLVFLCAASASAGAQDPVSSARAVEMFSQGLERAANRVRERTLLFEKAKVEDLKPEEIAELRTLWASFHDYAVALDGQKSANAVVRMALTPDRPAEMQRFMVAYAAQAAIFNAGLTLVEKASAKPLYEKLLDEADPERGVPAGAFGRLKGKILDPAQSGTLLAGHSVYRKLKEKVGKPPLGAPEFARLVPRIDSDYATVKAVLLRGTGVKLAVLNAGDVLKDSAFKAWFPVQKGVAGWMGDQRVRREGKNLITRAQIDGLRSKLEPGDIIVERRNWYLSNIGLPGFWPHAEMWLGTPDELDAYFQGDAELAAYLAQQPRKPRGAVALLKSVAGEKVELWATRDGLGEEPRIIKAVSEGVIFSSATHGMLADYIGVMRPRLSKLDKLRAIARSFGHQGKPYDFNFDFATDSELVCTELVYKSYRPPQDQGQGLKIPLVEVLGRQTLPANEWVRKFDQEYGTPAQELDFVAFLDGRESQGKAIDGTAQTFRKTHVRVKWDVAQK